MSRGIVNSEKTERASPLAETGPTLLKYLALKSPSKPSAGGLTLFQVFVDRDAFHVLVIDEIFSDQFGRIPL